MSTSLNEEGVQEQESCNDERQWWRTQRSINDINTEENERISARSGPGEFKIKQEKKE